MTLLALHLASLKLTNAEQVVQLHRFQNRFHQTTLPLSNGNYIEKLTGRSQHRKTQPEDR